MQELERLKDMLCKELYEISDKGELTAGALETVHKLTDTIKNIDKIEMLKESGYSEYGGNYGGGYGGGSSYRGGSYRNESGYDGGDSYAGRRGSHYVRAHYSRDGRGGYSRSDGKEYMIKHMREMMEEADGEKEREAIRRCISQLENA